MNPITTCRTEVRRSQARTAYVSSNYCSAIALLRDAQAELESSAGKSSDWWSLRATEAHNHRMRGDHTTCIAIALGALAQGVDIDPEDRLACAIDLLSSCIETKPLALTEKLAEEIFTDEIFTESKRGLCLRHYVLGLLAQRRGQAEEAYVCFARSWAIREDGYYSGYSRMVHLVKCAELSWCLGKEEQLAHWIGKMERTSPEIPCDEVRLRHARVLSLRLQPTTTEISAAIREIARGGLRILVSRKERGHYWNYACGLLYGLAAAGDLIGVDHFASAYSGGPAFERALWAADQGWFAAAASGGCPAPMLAPAPQPVPIVQEATLGPAITQQLVASYREIEDTAAKEDARLDCHWRTRLLASRLAQLGALR